MLGMKKYPKAYVEACRARVKQDVAAYGKAVGKKPGPFETTFFNDMVLLLDYLFVHRLRGVEGKDGNPLNEVRVLCNSMLLNDGVMTQDSSIKLTPADSILGYKPGDRIAVTESEFAKLSDAFFAEMRKKFL